MKDHTIARATTTEKILVLNSPNGPPGGRSPGDSPALEAICNHKHNLDTDGQSFQSRGAYGTTWTDNNNDYSATLWTGKSTTVTSYDLVRSPSYGLSFQTAYTYSPVATPQTPYSYSLGKQLPAEQQIVYKDWNGSTLRTVQKYWYNQCLLQWQKTTATARSGIAHDAGSRVAGVTFVQPKQQ